MTGNRIKVEILKRIPCAYSMDSQPKFRVSYSVDCPNKREKRLMDYHQRALYVGSVREVAIDEYIGGYHIKGKAIDRTVDANIQPLGYPVRDQNGDFLEGAMRYTVTVERMYIDCKLERTNI